MPGTKRQLSIGGLTRSANQTPERRREIARHAIAVRWAKFRDPSTPLVDAFKLIQKLLDKYPGGSWYNFAISSMKEFLRLKEPEAFLAKPKAPKVPLAKQKLMAAEDPANYPADWEERRLRALNRASYRCQGCDRYPTCMVENHKTHPKTGEVVELAVIHAGDLNNHEDLRTMCQRCLMAHRRDLYLDWCRVMRDRAREAIRKQIPMENQE